VLTGLMLSIVHFTVVFLILLVYDAISGGGGDDDGSHNMLDVYIVTTEVHSVAFYTPPPTSHFDVNGRDTIEINSLWHLNRHYRYFYILCFSRHQLPVNRFDFLL
jgi:hypothetical protein